MREKVLTGKYVELGDLLVKDPVKLNTLRDRSLITAWGVGKLDETIP